MEYTLTDLKKKVKRSFISLTARQILLRLIGFITINIILAKVLPVETLGIFNTATVIITIFAFFSDIGLAASLIQKKEEVKPEDINTTFTIQQILVGITSILVILLAPLLASFSNLNNEGVWLIRILGISFLLTSLKVIPSVLLERNLKFGPLVIVEVVETLTFNILLIILVYKGFNIWSFSYAALAKSFIGVVLIYILSPTKLGFGIEKKAALKLLSFGVPYQTNSLLALLKDRLVTLVVVRMVGPIGIGYITWAQALAFLPLELMTVVNRIAFPAFSRLQDDKKSLSIAVEKSLFATSIVVYPALFGLGAILPSLVSHVVSDKWQPAILNFYLFAFSTYWAVISTTLTNTLNAIGMIKTTLKLMVMWTVLTWILTPILVINFGFIGVGLTSLIISFSSIVTVIIVKKILTLRILDAIAIPTLASLIMSIVVFIYSQAVVKNEITLVSAILFGIIFYILLIYLLARERIIKDIRSLNK
jgi:O-antigen/teichoic acid export membrane protein